MKLPLKLIFKLSACFVLLFMGTKVVAQTENDAIMMDKKNLCIGPMYGYSSWTHYWEGTFNRDNQNLGTVSSQMFSIMGNYGVSKKLNVLFTLPYIETKASAGTLHGQRGVQDLSLWVKWMPVETNLGKGVFSVYGLGGFSFPTSNYVADYLPLSIGLHSTNFTVRGMADYQLGSFFTTLSASYVLRSNVKIDRDAYYDTEMHYTNEVDMPNAAQFMGRIGYRSDRLIAEGVVYNWTTLGGFDITKNNMPFLSNRMNMTTVGVNFKYNIPPIDGLSLTGGANYVVAGRNVGQATAYDFGIFYILSFAKAPKSTSNTPTQK